MTDMSTDDSQAVSGSNELTDLERLAQRLAPAIVSAPPLQRPPVQDVERQLELAAMTPLRPQIMQPISWLIAAGALVISAPATWLVVLNVYRNEAGGVLPVWACCLFLAAIILCGHATLLRLVPCRAALEYTWWVLVCGTGVAASFLGALLLAGQNSRLLASLQLHSNQLPLRITSSGGAAWSFAILNMLFLLTYVVGRVTFRQRSS
jgi:hypothetical protein